MRKWVCVFSVLFITIKPANVFAHVKWFTEADPERTSIEAFMSPLFFMMVFIAAISIGYLAILIPKIEQLPHIQNLQQKTYHLAVPNLLLRYGISLALFIQLINGNVFAPEFPIVNTFTYILIISTIILFLIPFHLATKIAAILLLSLYIEYAIIYRLFHLLDYSFYIGVALYFILNATKWEQRRFTILYVTTGFSLCWLAAEKWIYPGMTLNIIEKYGVPTFGFDPSIFTVMAAFVEFAIGFSWMMGVLNRFFAIIFTCIMTLTTLLFGVTELVGHFLIYLIMYVLIIRGVGDYKPTFKKFQSSKEQFIFLITQFVLILSAVCLIYFRLA